MFVTDELKQLYLNQAPRIVGYVVKNNYNKVKFFGSVEDMFQALMVKVWSILPRFDRTKGKFSTFIVKCCHNEIGVYIRKANAKRRKANVVSIEENIAENLKILDILKDKRNKDPEVFAMVQKIVPLLEDETRLYFLSEKTQREIAKEKNLSQPTVNKKIKKNILKIRRELESNIEEKTNEI